MDLTKKPIAGIYNGARCRKHCATIAIFLALSHGIFALPTTTTTSTTTLSGPILHYDFTVDEGELVSDQSGSGHTGKVFGATWTAEGVLDGSCRFDGFDYYRSLVKELGGGQHKRLAADLESLYGEMKSILPVPLVVSSGGMVPG